MASMWGDPSSKSLSEMLDGRIEQFGNGNIMGDYMPKAELDPEGSLQMFGGPGSGPGTLTNLPVHNNMGPQLTQHSMFINFCFSYLGIPPIGRSMGKCEWLWLDIGSR